MPSDHAKLAYFDCTSTYGLGVADGILALSGGIAAGSALSQSKQEYADKNNGASRNVAAGSQLILAGVLAASAVYGTVQATRCDRAKEALRARIFAEPLRPPPPPPPFPPPPAVEPPQPTLTLPPPVQQQPPPTSPAAP